MYLLTIAEQSRIFFYSCGFGFFLGFFYDLLTLFNEFLPKRKAYVIFTDVLFMVVSTFLIFLFSLSVDNGEFKFYIYSALAIGWLIYYFSVGVFTRRVKLTVSTFLKTVFAKCKRGILGIFSKLQKKRVKKVKKTEISSDLLLQESETLLYNNE